MLCDYYNVLSNFLGSIYLNAVKDLILNLKLKGKCLHVGPSNRLATGLA